MNQFKTETILAVDDNEASLYLLAKTLRGAGFQVLEASTGTDALRQSLELPDLIVLDVNLPDIHGWEVCRMIKDSPATGSIPVLHLSASSIDSTSAVRGLDGGADGYLTQPLEPEVLIATIHALLRVKRAELHWEATFESISDPICLLNAKRQVLRGNSAFQNLFHLSEAVLVKESIYELLKNDSVSIDETPQEIFFQGRNYLLSLRPVQNSKKESEEFVLVMNDITERKQNEENIRISLKEKELLIQEIHHRVKNNLQIIISLLSVQMHQVDDSEVRKMLEDSYRRIRAMSLIHELLYNNLASASVDLTSYLRQLSLSLMESYSTNGSIQFEYVAEPISVDLDKMLPLGLLLNELISNALKYAFSPGQKGTLSVCLKKLGSDHVEMIIGDNGKGIENRDQLGNSTSLGWKLIPMFVAQINATLEFLDCVPGTNIRIVFDTSK